MFHWAHPPPLTFSGELVIADVCSTTHFLSNPIPVCEELFGMDVES